MFMEKATKRQVKVHNQQLVLRAIYEGVADSRADISRETRLSKPTVSNIVTDLIDMGLVAEGGRGDSTSNGGKRATLLKFIPTAQQLIALTVDAERITGCLAYLDGAVVARHLIDLVPDDDILEQLHYAINGLMAQADAPLMCISVGLPGRVNDMTGVVIASPTLGWDTMPLADVLETSYDLPVVIGNNTEFATRAYFVTQTEPQSLVTLFVGDTIEIGSTFDGRTYQFGGDLSVLMSVQGAISQLEWGHVRQTVRELVQQYPDSLLNVERLTHLHIKRAIRLQDDAAMSLLEDLSTILAQVYAWILALMNPTQIILAGRMSHIGQPLLTLIRAKLPEALQANNAHQVFFGLAQDDDLTLQGAIANALNKELGIV